MQLKLAYAVSDATAVAMPGIAFGATGSTQDALAVSRAGTQVAQKSEDGWGVARTTHLNPRAPGPASTLKRNANLVRITASTAHRHATPAGCALSRMDKVRDLGTKYGERFFTPVRVDAPVMHAAVRLTDGAMKCAAPVEAPQVPAVMPFIECRAAFDGVAFGADGAVADGAMRLYDFKEAKPTVLDVVSM